MIWAHPWLKIVGALLLAPLAGGLLLGVDRKLTARIQGRQGPPIVQPFYDVLKLLRKSPIMVNRIQIAYAYLHLAFMVVSLFLVILGQDGVMILFTLAFSTLALVLGGMCVRSPYSRIGSQREIIMMISYEPILILLMIGLYLNNGSFLLDAVLASPRPLLLTMPLLFLAYLVVMAIKLQKSPFDLATSHHAHQEIVKGVTLEYSGPFLALIEITHFFETALLFAIVLLFWASNLWIGLALGLASFLAIVVVDNAFARLTSLWAFRFMWTAALALAVTNVVWLYV
jgi:ech hydrogenase subunit B